MENSKYPECEKMRSIKEKSELCGDFLEWLQSKYRLINRQESFESSLASINYSSYINFEELLAEFFNIDLDKVEEEKKQILMELRNK